MKIDRLRIDRLKPDRLKTGRLKTVGCGAGILLALALIPNAIFAVPESGLSTAVDALQKRDIADPDFQALLARIDAGGTPALKAKAYVLRCQKGIDNDPEAMRATADAGIAVARRAHAEAELGGLYLCRGYIEESAGRKARALADYTAAIEVLTRAGELNDAAQAQVLRGEQYHTQGRYVEALRDMQAAYERYLRTGNTRQQNYALNAIANFYADPRLAQYDKAIEYYTKLLAVHRAAGSTEEAATAQHNIASTYGWKGDYDKSAANFLAVMETYAATGNADGLAETRAAMAAMLLRANRASEALPLAEQALAYLADKGDADLLARARLTRGAALRQLGRYDQALAELDVAQTYFERESSSRFLERVAGERAETLAAQRRWQEAYAARSRQFSLSRELDAQLEHEVTARMRVQFDSEHTEHENAALQRENTLRKRALADAERIRMLQNWVILLGGLVLSSLLWLAWRLRRRARAMRELALTDELTGLLNRRAILECLQQRLQVQDAAAVAVMIFDIDHFKTINDLRGHAVGDEVLRQVAAAVQRTLGADGRLGRIGGEEFLVVVSESAATPAAAIGEHLRATIAALEFEGEAADLRIGISLGGSDAQPGRDRVEDVLKRADLALYRAKEGGRNRMEWQAAA